MMLNGPAAGSIATASPSPDGDLAPSLAGQAGTAQVDPEEHGVIRAGRARFSALAYSGEHPGQHPGAGQPPFDQVDMGCAAGKGLNWQEPLPA